MSSTKIVLSGEDLIGVIINQVRSIGTDWDSLQALAEHVFGIDIGTSIVNEVDDTLTFHTHTPEDFGK